MGRSILAVVLGIVLGGVVVGGVEYVGRLAYPPPAGMDMNNPEVVKEYVAQAPVGALLFVPLAWALGSLAGGTLAAKLSRQSHTRNALIVGGVLMVFGIANLVMIPSPLWMWVVGIAVFLPAAYLGAKLATSRQQTVMTHAT